MKQLLQNWGKLLQIVADFVISNQGNSYYKLGKLVLLQIGARLLQIGPGIINRGRFIVNWTGITNRSNYYKLVQNSFIHISLSYLMKVFLRKVTKLFDKNINQDMFFSSLLVNAPTLEVFKDVSHHFLIIPLFPLETEIFQ